MGARYGQKLGRVSVTKRLYSGLGLGLYSVSMWRTETPHVYRQSIARTEYDFRCAVEARLDVRVELLVFITARPEVDHLYTTASHLQPKVYNTVVESFR